MLFKLICKSCVMQSNFFCKSHCKKKKRYFYTIFYVLLFLELPLFHIYTQFSVIHFRPYTRHSLYSFYNIMVSMWWWLMKKSCYFFDLKTFFDTLQQPGLTLISPIYHYHTMNIIFTYWSCISERKSIIYIRCNSIA